jgi:hypothetical protein
LQYLFHKAEEIQLIKEKIFSSILNKILLLLALFGSVNAKVFSCEPDQDQPHIILHVDINRTLIAEDKSKGLAPDKCLAALLSTAHEYSHTWGGDLEKITYKKWVDEKLFPGSYRDQVLKKKRESCHTKFVEAARNKNHPMLNEINHELNSLLDALKTQGSRKVFKSFSNLVAYLKERNYPFSVILRTFGEDLDWVSQELAQDGLNFIQGSFCESVLHLNDRVFSNPADILAAFEPGKHYAIQDSYDWWKHHNLTENGGKPFPINISDKRVLSIFFDDSANSSKRQILKIIPFGGEKVNLNELIEMGRVVAVDTRNAIRDPHYYISAVEKVLEKW